MKPVYGLQLVQSQRLSLTPELRQAITVLQMNVLELTEFIKAEAEANPLLEVTDESRDEPLPEPSELTIEEYLASAGEGAYYARYPKSNLSRGDYLTPAYERHVTSRPDLRNYLLSQLGLMRLTKREYEASEYVVGSIDNNGYLVASDEDIAEASGFSSGLIGRTVEIVRTLEPLGIGARSLRECLMIQAKARKVSPFALLVIERHLEDLGAGRYKKIAKEHGVPLREVLDARDVVLSLDPKPGSRFSPDNPVYVVPDVMVERDEDRVVVHYNDKAIPSIRWNTYYIQILKSGDLEARAYLQDRLQKARSVMNSIEQRRVTVLRVIECLVRRQDRFFKEGLAQLQPLTLREVASELSVHESTVSRSTSNKHISTPFGTFPCRVFFSPRVQAYGKDLSQHTVKMRIQEMTESEDPQNPLSDQDIADGLSQSGIKIARRTVAKYRATLGIQPSGRRRRL